MKNAIITRTSQLQAAHNAEIIKGFYECYQKPDIRRSHLFNGRYENIYLNTDHVSALTPLLNEVRTLASDITAVKNLKLGYWFNLMPPGSVTTAHSHDDSDELLSAVYYLQAPQNSGDLLIHFKDDKRRLTPETGLFVFFKPDVIHEVTINNSKQDRLSLAINFGADDTAKTGASSA